MNFSSCIYIYIYLKIYSLLYSHSRIQIHRAMTSSTLSVNAPRSINSCYWAWKTQGQNEKHPSKYYSYGLEGEKDLLLAEDEVCLYTCQCHVKKAISFASLYYLSVYHFQSLLLYSPAKLYTNYLGHWSGEGLNNWLMTCLSHSFRF